MVAIATGDSVWFQTRFGFEGGAVVNAIATAGRIAHELSADSKAASGLATDEPYGAVFWQVLARELVEALSGVQGVQTFKPIGSRFELPVVNGSVIFAAKCAANSGPEPDRLVVRWSNFRERLFDEVARPQRDYLPLPEWSEENEPAVSRPESPSGAVVMVAFVSSDRGGLERIFVGDGYLLQDGAVRWVYCEEIQANARHVAGRLVPVDESRAFDDAPMPGLGLELRDDRSETVQGAP